jgi:hypothetical protein
MSEWTSEQEREFRCLAAREAVGMLLDGEQARLDELSASRRECLGEVTAECPVGDLEGDIGKCLRDIAAAIREHTAAQENTQREKWRRQKAAYRAGRKTHAGNGEREAVPPTARLG